MALNGLAESVCETRWDSGKSEFVTNGTEYSDEIVIFAECSGRSAGCRPTDAGTSTAAIPER